MKILILANHYKTIANFRLELVERLVSDGHDVIISLPRDEHNSIFRDVGCTVAENDMTRHGINPFSEFKLIQGYKKLIKDLKPDLVLTYTIKPNIYGSIACRKCKVPVFNNITGIGSTMQGGGIKSKIVVMLQKYAMKHSNLLFFQNSANMEFFNKKGIGTRRSVLLPGSGVNLEKHKFVPYPEENGKIKVAVISRLRYDKGFDELFEAIKSLKNYDNTEFHIVGWCEEDRYQIEIEELCRSYPVIYHGEKTQSEVHEILAGCHAILHPSHHEGMANVLMEASAAGRACIASDVPGCREIVEEDVTGFKFDVKCAGAIVDALEKFFALSPYGRKLMGEKARKKMESEFDRQIVIEIYLKHINGEIK